MAPDQPRTVETPRTTAADEAPARLTIHRTSPDDEGSPRQILCSLDGDYVGQLLHGQALTREIAAGSHRFTANNTLYWKTVPFTARPGEHVEFTVMNLAWGGTVMKMLFIFFGAAPLKLAVAPGPPRRG
jgi:hypothetical protein